MFYSAISANWWLKGSAEQLNEKEFNQKVGKGEYHYVISFFTPWCQYCQQMAPEYNKLSDFYKEQIKNDENLEDKVIIAKLNCQENQEFCQKMRIPGYPTIKFYNKDSQNINQQFQQSRTYKQFYNWIEKQKIHTNQIYQNQLKQQDSIKLQKQKNEQNETEQNQEEKQQPTQEEIEKIIESDKKQQEEIQKHIQQDLKNDQDLIKKQEELLKNSGDNPDYKELYENQVAQIDSLTKKIQSLHAVEAELKQQNQYLQQKLGELYQEVNEVFKEIHDIRNQEIKQSQQTLTILNDYLYQETEQQKKLITSQKNIQILHKKLIGNETKTEINKSKAQKQNQTNDQNYQNLNSTENQNQNNNLLYEIPQNQDELFVFGLTGVLLGFIIGFMNLGQKKKKKQFQYTKQENQEKELPLTDLNKKSVDENNLY